MRIIAGDLRGRKFLPPDTTATRPITDRAKQSLFDILNPHLEGAMVYDCFAGTGSMGLESLSRGCKFATFFESDRSALKRLRENLQTLGLQERSHVIAGDLLEWAMVAPKSPEPINLIFLDPPYRLSSEQPKQMAKLVGRLAMNHLSPAGILVFRHDGAGDMELPPLRRYDVREYGGMRIEFLSHPES